MPVFSRAASTAETEAVPFFDFITAQAPVTWGAAIEVPLEKPKPVQRYPGALSELEEALARSMTSLADRRRRRRRAAATAAIVVLLAVAAALSLLWRRSVQETRRAEAAKLLALAQARLADDPTEALALTTASLEVADAREAREFVMRVLWTAPPALELVVEEEGDCWSASFSLDGIHIATGGFAPEVRVWSDDGAGPIRLGGHSVKPPNTALWADNNLVVTSDVIEGGTWPPYADRTKLWSIPDGTLLRTVELALPGYWNVGPRRLFAQIEHGEGGTAQHGTEVLAAAGWQYGRIISLSGTILGAKALIGQFGIMSS